MSTVEVFNLIASIFGIVTGFIALILSVIFYLSARNSEKNSDSAMNEIKTSTAQLSKLSMRLLDRLTSAIIAPRPTEERLIDTFRELMSPANPIVIPPEESGKANLERTEQWRVDNLITACFYAATTNLTTQILMPEIPEDTQSFSTYSMALNNSSESYNNLLASIYAAEEYERKINSSPAKHLYLSIKSVEPEVKSTDQFYASKTSKFD